MRSFGIHHAALAAAALTLLSVAATVTAGDGFPPRFEAVYSLHTKGIKVAEMTRELETAVGGGFVFRSETVATGLVGLFRREHVTERSHWEFAGDQVQPLLYRYERSGGKRDRVVSVDFDPDKSEVLNTYNDKTWRMAVPDGVLDKLLYQLVMMRDLATAADGTYSYAIADGGKVKTYRYETRGSEAVETPLGTFEAVIIERNSESSAKRTRIWCARALNYLPVRVEHRDKKGNETVARLESLQGLGQAAVAR